MPIRVPERKKILLVLTLLAVALGIFFRTYEFRNWLHFGNDQARDAVLVENVVTNHAPWPLLGSSMGNTGFLLGPVYYYFQIVSVRIFGIGPEKLAYPDLFFNLLSIPLLHAFLKRFFSRNISLSLTGLYSISYYAVEYSRFAWNPNPIPFFVILFLWSLWEFLLSEEKTDWKWVVLLGIAYGVGSQLHAILMLTMSGVLGLSFLFSMKRSRGTTWSRWAVVLLLLLVANTGQIIHETRTDYSNSKVFLSSFTDKSDNGGSKNFVRNLVLDVACQSQANTLITSSLGNKENCDFLYSKARNMKPNAKLHLPSSRSALLGIFLSLCFSVFGYFSLAVRVRTEQDRRKRYFAGVVLLYAAVSFSVMLPIINLAPMRYFIHTTFLPFIFIGFLVETLLHRHPRRNMPAVAVIFALLAATNIRSIYAEALQLRDKTRADSGYVVLDEAEPLADFMVAHADGKKEAYLYGGKRYYSPYNKTLSYLAAERGLRLRRGADISNIPADTPAFYVGPSVDEVSPHEADGVAFSGYLNVGQIGIYKLR